MAKPLRLDMALKELTHPLLVLLKFHLVEQQLVPVSILLRASLRKLFDYWLRKPNFQSQKLVTTSKHRVLEMVW